MAVFSTCILAIILSWSLSSRGDEIAQSRYWKLLLHTHPGTDKSEADGDGFWLSPLGRSDPEAELEADVKAFGDPHAPGVGHLQQHPQCAFPERYRFLKEALHLKIVDQDCRAFTEWKNNFHALSVSIVYAAPYLGSPASMFGHTFLRINAKPRTGTAPNELLDNGISYEAVTGGDAPVLYAAKGLLGSYPGFFSLQPYYLKVNTYHNIENRDLWEYELNLTSEQIDHLLNHVWEMGTTYFNYYFLNRNCSYHLLALLEVANPEWHLRDHFSIQTIPIDTVRALVSENNAIRKIAVRRSLLWNLEKEFSNLNDSQKDIFDSAREHYQILSAQTPTATLDALLDYEKYKAMSQAVTIGDVEGELDQRLLVLRAKRGTDEEQSSRPPKDEQAVQPETHSPTDGHRSTKLSLGAGSENGAPVVALQFRPVLHDQMDLDDGYVRFSSLVLARAGVSYLADSHQKIRLDDFTAAEVSSLSPLTHLHHDFSWKIGGGFFRPLDTLCLDCVAGHFYGALGETLPLFHERAGIVYGLLHAQGEVSNGFNNSLGEPWRLGPSVELGHFSHPFFGFKTHLAYEQLWYFAVLNTSSFFYSQALAELSWTKLPFELRFSGKLLFLPSETASQMILNVSWFY